MNSVCWNRVIYFFFVNGAKYFSGPRDTHEQANGKNQQIWASVQIQKTVFIGVIDNNN